MRIYLSICLLLTLTFLSVAESYTLFTENGKVGLKNEKGLIVIPATYEALGWSNGSFSIEGQVTGYKLKGSWGVLNLKNERVTPAQYFSLTEEDGLIIASKRSVSFQVSTGCIDAEGKTVIPFVYTGVKVHSMRIVAFIREGNLFKHGLIDLENKVLIPFKFRNIYPIGSLRYAVEDYQGKTALYSESGKQISGFSIDSISLFNNNLAIIYEAGKQGLITREGELKSEAKYREIELNQKSIKARMSDVWGVLEAGNKLIETIEADSVVSLGASRYKIGRAGQIQLTDNSFKTIQQDFFSEIYPFQKGFAVFKSGNHYGVIKKTGTIVLTASFQKIILQENYILTQEKNIDKTTWSLRDTLGRKQNSKTFDLICEKQGTIFPVRRKGYWGAINDAGAEIIASVYDSILEAGDNQVAVKFKGQYGIINLNEHWLAYPQPYPVRLLNQDRYFKKAGNTLFLCSFNGTVLYFTTNPIDIKENFFTESVSTGGTWTIDFDGRIVNRQLPPVESTEKIFPSTEGLRGIKKNGRYGFIDDQGLLRIANRYENIKPFSEGLAAIKIRNKWGFINRDETIKIQPAYEEVTPFEKGYSIVKQNGMYGLLAHEGKLVLPARYHGVQILDNGRLLLTLNGLQGLADQQGNILLYPKYSSVTDLNNGYVIIQQNGKYGLVTLQGISTIPLLYDQLKYDAEKNRYLALNKSEWVMLQ
jgi:hypothetical protein